MSGQWNEPVAAGNTLDSEVNLFTGWLIPDDRVIQTRQSPQRKAEDLHRTTIHRKGKMMANSFKQMIKAGVIKRSDSGMFISLDDVHVKPGFNKREDDERTRQADDALFQFLIGGGIVPPLEVIAKDNGGVWLVEGHRRRRCYERCRAAGKPVNRIHIVPFTGNDVERLARIMTSNNQLPLSPLEQSAVIKVLTSFNLTTAEIAKLVNKSIPTIEKLLTLSTANYDVQQSVKAGEVSVDVAVDRVRQHGENAGKVLEKDKAAATAAGKKKVTRSIIKPELSIKKARRIVTIINAGLNDSGSLILPPDQLGELQILINEHRKLTQDTAV